MKLIKVKSGSYKSPGGRYSIYRKSQRPKLWIICDLAFLGHENMVLHKLPTKREAKEWLENYMKRGKQ